MKFDTVIIGGGLSGLTCGIRLTEQGQKCAIISSGQSALHFFAGSFDLLAKVDEKEVLEPLEAMKNLPRSHPYSRIGNENTPRLAEEAKLLLNRAGITLEGQSEKNHYVLTPMATMKPTWLTLADFSCFYEKHSLPYENALIVNLKGFLDFHSQFIKDGLKKMDIKAEISEITMKQLETIRRNPCEMRSANIAKIFEQETAIDEFASKVNKLDSDAEVIILPSVFGLFNNDAVTNLKSKLKKPVIILPVTPPSTPGIRTQNQLCQRFQALGGTYLLGDRVEGGALSKTKLFRITTKNHGDIAFKADNFVLASGSFYSKGIVATPKGLYEPILGLDIDGDHDRSKWFDAKLFNAQPFMHYGVKTDDKFRAMIGGEPINNLYVAGSVLAGANPLKEGSGAGICLLSSLYVAEKILG
ncbi:MAG: glycerol-3-phosphate dehydrogenase subunit GlpB [Desulfotalea sp.]